MFLLLLLLLLHTLSFLARDQPNFHTSRRAEYGKLRRLGPYFWASKQAMTTTVPRTALSAGTRIQETD